MGDEIIMIEILREIESSEGPVPVEWVISDPARRVASYGFLAPVLTHMENGSKVMPTRFDFCLN